MLWEQPPASRINWKMLVESAICGWATRTLMQRKLPQLHQIAKPQHPVNLDHVVRIAERELMRQCLSMRASHAGAHLEPHHSRELPLVQLALDHRQGVVGVLSLPLGDH